MSKESNISREQVKAIVMEHNAAYPNNQLGLVNTSELIDISNYYVCTYGNNEVDLFTKKHINQQSQWIYSSAYWSYIIYTSYSNNNIAIRALHEHLDDTDYFYPVGDKLEDSKKTYLVTCVIDSEMSFDNMRQKMKDIGEIKDFIPGKATQEEITQVLSFARKYYEPKINANDLYICIYDDQQIDLFKRKTLNDTEQKAAQEIYIGYNNNLMGIFTHFDQYDRHIKNNNWEQIGYNTTWDKKTYNVTCNIKGAISFNSIRQIMQNAKIISSFIPHQTTKEEILAVIKYVKEHYKEIKEQIEANQPPEVKISDSKKAIRVNDLYICAYNENKVGLFTKKTLSEYEVKFLKKVYWNESIYRGYDVYSMQSIDNIGIFTSTAASNTINQWRNSGYLTHWYGKNYYVNCDMYDAISFDEMRQIMYNCGEIPSFEYGIATDEEIQIVLKYAKEYFGLSNPKERKRIPQ